MKRIKRILMFISVLVMCTAFIPVNTVKAEESASVSISSASMGKRRDNLGV